MTDNELERLGVYIAESLIKKGLESSGVNWQADNDLDHLVGELARCMTLQGIYEEREEDEKCAMMKIMINEINDKLGIDISKNEEDDDGDEI